MSLALRPRSPTVVASGIGCLYVLVFLGLLLADRQMVEIGRPDLRSFQGEVWVIVAGIASATVVGVALASARPRHPVGWLFLGLAGSMLASGVIDVYTEFGVLARPGSLPAADVVAVAGDGSFIPWLVFVALILYLTPTGRAVSPRWATVARATVVAGCLGFALGMVSERELSSPYQDVRNPWVVPAIQPAADIVCWTAVLGVGVGLVVGAVSLLVRFKRAALDERRQLMWLTFAVIPLPAFVIASFVTARTSEQSGTLLATAGFVVLVPVAAGLSVSQFHLYEVEHLLASTVKYVILSALLVVVYGTVVFAAVRGLGSWSTSPELSATLGALTAAVVAAPLHSALQDGLDRRFNRRSYDARRVIAAGLEEDKAGTDVQALLRRAFNDPSLTIAYPGPTPGAWLTDEGLSPSPAAAVVDVGHHGRVVARIGYDPEVNDADTVEGAAALAASELDNARMRAELARQVDEVSASRRRLAQAQRHERRQIERDLHDGAQQTLLGLAFDLQAAQVNGDPSRMRSALSDGAQRARSAVRELRELANGLHPTALTDGGLAAALDDLARRSPVPIRVRASVPRLDPALEFTAWLMACEAIVNAQKHAHADCIAVDVDIHDSDVRLVVRDDGRGGANPDGPGLRGMRDRAETARGSLVIESQPGLGTRIEASLPCGS